MSRIVSLAILGSSAVVLALAPTMQAFVAAADAPGSEEQSLKAVCAGCHNLQIVMNTPRSRENWHETIQQMVDRGAKATDEQLADIVAYLDRTMTTINVNKAGAEDIEFILEVRPEVAEEVVRRRIERPFLNAADLKSVRGINPAKIDAKINLIFFR